MVTLIFLLALASDPAVADAAVTNPSAATTPQMPTLIAVPEAARASPTFNPDKATAAYLAEIPAAASARSDAYFEGGYWLILWDFIAGTLISLALLQLRWSARMRDFAQRTARRPWLQSVIYWLQYTVLTALLGFPLTVYEGYVREHEYGLATQTFAPWMGDQLKGIAVALVLGGIAFSGLLAIVRRLQLTWWIWGTVASTVFMIIIIVVAPVYIVPIFNTSKPLAEGPIKTEVLRMAHQNGIPVDNVYEVDASKQSTRMSANVSGFANTMRITLNDNLLARATPGEVAQVMGHEMGHYVLNHVLKSIIYMFIIIGACFAWLRWSLAAALARYGERWGVRGVSDPAVLPVLMLSISIFFLVLTPVMNSFTRLQEEEADIFGLNTSRQPDGAAQAAIHLGEYRKMNPGRLEEIVFFDHPSGRNRIHMAMVWKAQNLGLEAAKP